MLPVFIPRKFTIMFLAFIMWGIYVTVCCINPRNVNSYAMHAAELMKSNKLRISPNYLFTATVVRTI